MASMLGRRATTKSPTLSGGNSPQVLRANIVVPLSVRPGAPSRPSYRTIHLVPALRHAFSKTVSAYAWWPTLCRRVRLVAYITSHHNPRRRPLGLSAIAIVAQGAKHVAAQLVSSGAAAGSLSSKSTRRPVPRGRRLGDQHGNSRRPRGILAFPRRRLRGRLRHAFRGDAWLPGGHTRAPASRARSGGCRPLADPGRLVRAIRPRLTSGPVQAAGENEHGSGLQAATVQFQAQVVVLRHFGQ